MRSGQVGLQRRCGIEQNIVAGQDGFKAFRHAPGPRPKAEPVCLLVAVAFTVEINVDAVPVPRFDMLIGGVSPPSGEWFRTLSWCRGGSFLR